MDHILLAPTSDPHGNHYPYTSLSPSTPSIRLLEVADPAEDSGNLNCTLTSYPLEACPPYEALSYTWANEQGSLELCRMLSIDGHRVVTTNNLYSALKAVLAPRRGVKFWVDAISINQSDLIERNHQVSQMREVYEHADGVALWLGERGCNSDKAFAFFKAVNGIGGLRKRYEALGVTHLGDEKLWSSGVQELGAVSHLFGRSYWRRIWILQELAFAKKIVVHCGEDKLPWKALADAQFHFWTEGMWLREAFEASEIGHTLSNVWSHGPREVIVYDKPGDRKFLPLGELLTQHRYKSASDPRDMVYSLLGLRDEIHGLEFEIDYRRTTSEVFIEAAKYVINTEKSIQLIAVTKLEKELCSNGQPLTMPTWTPNLGGSYYSKSMVSVLVLKQDAFIACGQTSAVAWVADDNVLSAKGVYVGTIQDIAELTPNYNDAEWDFLQTWRVLRDWWVKYLEWRPEDILSRIGEEGEFFDLMVLGDWHRECDLEIRQKRVDEATRSLKVVMKAFEPTADTTISFLEAYGTDEEKAPGWQVGESDLKRAQMVLWQVAPRFRNRSLMLVREEQRLGMRPPCAKVGDVVVVIYGCTVPLVLRRRTEEDGGGFLNIGDAYLTGYMDGQAIDQVERGELKAQTFKIF